jgi:hypothetical protein
MVCRKLKTATTTIPKVNIYNITGLSRESKIVVVQCAPTHNMDEQVMVFVDCITGEILAEKSFSNEYFNGIYPIMALLE